MNRLIVTAIMAVFFGHAAAAEAPPLTAQCLSCHGVNGRSQIPYVPIIHGQQSEYLRLAMRAYRDGDRTHGRAPVMGSYMRNLSDAEIDALADWFGEVRDETVGAASGEYSALPVTVAEPAIEPSFEASVAAPVPANDRIVYIEEDEGWQRMLDAEHNRDYFMLNSYVESERFLTFCAIASMAAVLNSLEIERPLDPLRYPYPFFTQENLFVLANQQVRTFEQVVTAGLTLAEIGQFLEHLQVRPDVIFASDMTVDQMREAVRRGLDDRDKRVIVNYDRAVLGQNGSGHVSPIGAYDEETDSVLVLDVARYKYPPVWVPFSTMFDAMQSVDTGSNRSRGIVVVGALQ